jgi:hypothetical protein
MTPVYQVRVWQDAEWWLARITGASEGADPAPLNALTQARSLARIETMGRDLIATILDSDEASFEIDVEYDLPGDAGDLVRQATGARAWLEAAQDLWHERSAAAAQELAGRGYSLRDAAALLRLSHQRVDQLLGSHPGHRRADWVVVDLPTFPVLRWPGGQEGKASVDSVAALLRLPRTDGGGRPPPLPSELENRLRERIRDLLSGVESDLGDAQPSGDRRASA